MNFNIEEQEPKQKKIKKIKKQNGNVKNICVYNGIEMPMEKNKNRQNLKSNPKKQKYNHQ